MRNKSIDELVDNSKRQLCFVATLLATLAIGIMILSIVAIDNFGDDFKESFKMMDSNKEYRNLPKQ